MSYMENEYTVHRLTSLIFILVSVLSAVPVPAQKTPEVSVRYSRQEGSLRVVLESDDETIRGTVATPSLASLRIELPVRADLRLQKDFPLELQRKDRVVTIPLKDVSEVKTYRLASPARIVFDIRPSARPPQADPKTEKQVPVQKAPATASQPQPQQTGQKPEAQQAGQKPPQAAGAKAPEQHPQAEKGKKVKTIMLDAGHGGYESGITNQNVKEKDINLTLAKELSTLLAKKGYTVLMTRKVDQPSSLTERINFANGKNPDLFISLHASSSDQPAIYTAAVDEQAADAMKLFGTAFRQSRHLARSRSLAKSLAEALKADLAADVAVRELPLPLLSSMNATAVMVDYPSVTAYASDAKLRDRFVSAITKGIAAYEQ
jgi:N-acetylmuramoyl-L-alanine amidase